MIEELANSIACKIKDANPNETHDIDIMTYSLSVILNFVFALLITVTVSYAFDNTVESLLSFFTFVVLRFFSGGYHLKNLDLCTVVSATIFITIPFIDYGTSFTFVVTTISVLLVIIFSPYTTKKSDFMTSTKKYMKIVSAMIVLLNFYIQSDVISSTLLVQSILLVHYRGGEYIEKIHG